MARRLFASRASMRPPQNAGEDDSNNPLGNWVLLASMRPPQNAGEDNLDGAAWPRLQIAASMRPPQNAGEDLELALPRIAVDVASMRPPQNAGEDCEATPRRPPRSPGFNEAPAERGGRPRAAMW